jgi:uncharacterized membrane protein
MKRTLKGLIVAIAFALLGGIAAFAVYNSQLYLSGTYTMGYLYRSNLVFASIAKGDFYPLLNLEWFNGIQPLRYTSPIPIYILALLRFITGGNGYDAYLIFLGLLVFAGGISWYWMGARHNRCFAACFIGILWFILPANLATIFVDGDLGKAVCLVIIPVLIESIIYYYTDGRMAELIRIMVCCALMWLCSTQTTVVVLSACAFFVIICFCIYHHLRRAVHVICASVLGSMWSGFWLFAAYKRDYTYSISASELQKYFASFSNSFNPLSWLSGDGMVSNYLGLSILVLAIFGVLFARKKSIAAFITGLILLLGTASALWPLIEQLPFKNYMGMLQFVSVAAALVMVGYLMWDSLKKPLAVIVWVVLFADAVWSAYAYNETVKVNDRNYYEEQYLVKEAKEVTNQRLLLLDYGDDDTVATYLLADGDDGISVTSGYDWDNSEIAINYEMLNEAFDMGSYTYIFDRAVELGNDSVLIRTAVLDESEKSALDRAGNRLGYELEAASEQCRLYHMDVDYSFGVVNNYQAIGIGTGARRISLDFPAMEETSDPNLNNYSYDELSKYKLIYLSGFTYSDKSMAETLIQRLSESGVHIVIAADGIPEDKSTTIQSFLGAVCSRVNFSNGFPELDTIDGIIYPTLFPVDHKDWQTVYVNGLKDVWGTLQMEGHTLDFYGTVYNDNIVVIGLNLTYYYGVTFDEQVGELLAHAMDLTSNDLPERRIVPMEITKNGNQVQITVEEDNVDTTFAYNDIYETVQNIEDRNQIMYVSSGKTVIQLKLPYILEGIVVSLMGLFIAGVLCWRIRIYTSRKYIEDVELTGVYKPATGDIIKTSTQIFAPKDAPYVIENVVWYDERGREIREGQRFETGKNSLKVTMRTLGRARFSNNLNATIDGNKVEGFNLEQQGMKLSVEISYEMVPVYVFKTQPASVEINGKAPIIVEWELLLPAKIGYIERLYDNEDNWQICGVVDHTTGAVQSFAFTYEGKESVSYRLLYILGNGMSVYSNEFVVRWNVEDTVSPIINEDELTDELPNDLTEELQDEIPSKLPDELPAKQTDKMSDAEVISIPEEKNYKQDKHSDYDYDYDYDFDDDVDSWYDELSKKNEKRFGNRNRS